MQKGVGAITAGNTMIVERFKMIDIELKMGMLTIHRRVLTAPKGRVDTAKKRRVYTLKKGRVHTTKDGCVDTTKYGGVDTIEKHCDDTAKGQVQRSYN